MKREEKKGRGKGIRAIIIIAISIMVLSIIFSFFVNVGAVPVPDGNEAEATTEIGVNVGNVGPIVDEKWEIVNLANKTWPNKSVETDVKICAIVCDDNGIGDIDSVGYRIYYPAGNLKASREMSVAGEGDECREDGEDDGIDDVICEIYSGKIDMWKNESAGKYNVSVDAFDKYGLNGEKNNTFSWNEILGISVDEKNFNWGAIAPGGESTIFGDYCYKDLVNGCAAGFPTIMNIGNIMADAMVFASNLTGNGEIGANNLYLDIGGKYNSSLKENEGVRFNISLAPLDIEYVNAKIKVPYVLPGSYKGDMFFYAVEA